MQQEPRFSRVFWVVLLFHLALLGIILSAAWHHPVASTTVSSQGGTSGVNSLTATNSVSWVAPAAFSEGKETASTKPPQVEDSSQHEEPTPQAPKSEEELQEEPDPWASESFSEKKEPNKEDQKGEEKEKQKAQEEAQSETLLASEPTPAAAPTPKPQLTSSRVAETTSSHKPTPSPKPTSQQKIQSTLRLHPAPTPNPQKKTPRVAIHQTQSSKSSAVRSHASTSFVGTKKTFSGSKKDHKSKATSPSSSSKKRDSSSTSNNVSSANKKGVVSAHQEELKKTFLAVRRGEVVSLPNSQHIKEAGKGKGKEEEGSGKEGQGEKDGHGLASQEGLTQGAIDAYHQTIHDQFYQQWEQPFSLSWEERVGHVATLEVEIDSTGKILRKQLTHTSGNTLIDQSVEQTAEKVEKIAPPPKGLLKKGSYTVALQFEVN